MSGSLQWRREKVRWDNLLLYTCHQFLCLTSISYSPLRMRWRKLPLVVAQPLGNKSIQRWEKACLSPWLHWILIWSLCLLEFDKDLAIFQSLLTHVEKLQDFKCPTHFIRLCWFQNPLCGVLRDRPGRARLLKLLHRLQKITARRDYLAELTLANYYVRRNGKCGTLCKLSVADPIYFVKFKKRSSYPQK